MKYLRWLAQAALVLYALLAMVVLTAAAGEDNGAMLTTLLVVSVPLGASGLYYAGLARPTGARGRLLRSTGWFAMLAGSIALISFSFVVWPLLLLAAPYSFLLDGTASVRRLRG